MTTREQLSNSGETSTEIEFAVRDSTCFFIRASSKCECYLKLEKMVHGTDDQLLKFFTIEAAPPQEIFMIADESDGVNQARLIRETDTEDLYEFEVSGPCVAKTLADVGAVVRTVIAHNGVGYVVAYLPPHVDKQPVIARFQQRHEAELLSSREMNRSAPEFTRQEFREVIVQRLTDRQLEVLQTAYRTGYYEWPRETTAEDCADSLDISQPTFTQHLRVAQGKLLNTLFTSSNTRAQHPHNR